METLRARYCSALTENERWNCFLRLYEPGEPAPASGALAGLTFAVKDNISVAAQPVTCGTRPPLIGRAERDADVVFRLRQAGGALLGSTNLDELCVGSRGSNRHYGQVLNPAAPHLSPLGSSSGSATAVAAGLVDFALGTDFAGSVRLPAAAGRIAGLKLTAGSVSAQGLFLLDPEFDALGILASTPEQILAPLQVLTPRKDEARCSACLIPCDQELLRIPSEMRAHFSASVSRIGADESLSEPFFARAGELFKPLAAAAAANRFRQAGFAPDALPDEAKALLLLGEKISAAQFSELQQHKRELTELIAPCFDCGALILTPALPCPVPAREQIDAETLYLPFFLTLANLLGLPALTFHVAGCPIALQLVGPPGSEYRLLLSAQAASRRIN